MLSPTITTHVPRHLYRDPGPGSTIPRGHDEHFSASSYVQASREGVFLFGWLGNLVRRLIQGPAQQHTGESRLQGFLFWSAAAAVEIPYSIIILQPPSPPAHPKERHAMQ